MTDSKSRIIVTGVAGFVGSHLAERLALEGHSVVGIDSFTDYYPRSLKEANLVNLCKLPNFNLVEGDLLEIDLSRWLDGTEYIFHEAAQAGVRNSWGDGFSVYVRHNVLATQRLLEAAKGASTLKRLLFASSSSVYGDAERLPTPESGTPAPASPYGITKLAGEHLCRIFHQNFNVPLVVFRYFTAYGPRQRPDMAFCRFIEAMLTDKEIVVYGDGNQTRDFTFVSDIVAANLLAMNRPVTGEVFNIGGGARITIAEVIAILEKILGRPARIRFVHAQKGDARHTSADISRAQKLLGYQPAVGIEEGLRRQVQWQSSRRESEP